MFRWSVNNYFVTAVCAFRFGYALLRDAHVYSDDKSLKTRLFALL